MCRISSGAGAAGAGGIKRRWNRGGRSLFPSGCIGRVGHLTVRMDNGCLSSALDFHFDVAAFQLKLGNVFFD